MGNGFEITKTIAAFSGAGIGLVNLVWSLIKEFKVGCKVNIISHEIKSENVGKYIIKIDFQISASNKDLYIQEIKLKNHFMPFISNYDELSIDKIYDYFDDKELFNKSYSEIEDLLSKRKNTLLNSYKISKGEYKRLSIVAGFLSNRAMDGFDDIPSKGYELKLQINDKVYRQYFNFDISKNSDISCFFEPQPLLSKKEKRIINKMKKKAELYNKKLYKLFGIK